MRFILPCAKNQECYAGGSLRLTLAMVKMTDLRVGRYNQIPVILKVASTCENQNVGNFKM